ncbi:MAG: hypothetical protein FWH20_07055 [Oscillospiraceae bacterium]|nr:hypothetical protein [Oscillospiraceae bacterium]
MLFWFELKKTLLAPVMLGFIALCIVLNVIIVLAHDTVNLDKHSAEPFNVFEEYDASELADYYVRLHGMSGGAEENIRAKYDKLQLVIDEKANDGDALSAYFGYDTYYLHNLLFGTLFFAVIIESCLIALFAVLLSTGYENTRNTEQLICTSKTGRRILRKKLVAALATGLAAFTVILIISLIVLFACFDYSAVWGDNVSSSFNFAPNEWPKPFITWHSFTVAGLFLAVTLAAAGLTLVFTLFGFALGAVFRSGYISCGVAVALCVLQFITPFMLQMGGTLRGVLNLTPVMLWVNSGKWFTDGGAGIVWSNFESFGIIVLLVILSVLALLTESFYKRRDLL